MVRASGQKGVGIRRAVQDIVEGRYNEMELIGQYGFERGQTMANILAAHQLGLLTRSQVNELIQEHIQSFYGIEYSKADDTYLSN